MLSFGSTLPQLASQWPGVKSFSTTSQASFRCHHQRVVSAACFNGQQRRQWSQWLMSNHTHHQHHKHQPPISTLPPSQQWSTLLLMSCATALFIAGHLTLPTEASAHIPLSQNSATTYILPPEVNLGIPPGQRLRIGQAAVLSQQRDISESTPSTASRAKAAIALLNAAHDEIHSGQFEQALNSYTSIVKDYGDLALASYARTGRALMLYQVGQTSNALLELEDQEARVLGTAEVHAALAALLWQERPSLAFRAEQQWEVAVEFDSRYKDPSWVAVAKHWPPRAVKALESFLTLQR